MTKRALYLAGGGARGAWQAGALKAIAQITDSSTLPFQVLGGVSIGSINGAILAEGAHDFQAAVEKLEHLWCNLHCDDIYNASNYELSKSVLRNLGTLFHKQRHSGHLLNTEPLNALIHKHINFDAIETNIANHTLETFEVISNCYETHQTVSFYQHHGLDFEDWAYPKHISERTIIQAQHILSSSALPLFFPPLRINGFHYGDGSMGLITPLRGMIRFEVNQVLILGTRRAPKPLEHETLRNGAIGFASMLGSMMNALFLDNLDRDIEMVNRMNDIARMISLWKKRRSPWRPIQTTYLRPTIDIGHAAQDHYKALPAFLRYLLNILGAQSRSGDLLSFLLFEKEFTAKLLQQGYEDTMANAKGIEAFFA